MIVIEGPDGAGKTTLLGHLSKLYPDIHIPDFGPRDKLPQLNVRARVYTSLAQAISCKHPMHMHDRLYFSELVYGPILRGSCAFSVAEQKFIEAEFRLLNIPIILCLPPIQWVQRNVQRDDQMKGVAEHITDIYDAYVALAQGQWEHLNIRIWDYRNLSNSGLHKGMPKVKEELQPMIERYLFEREERNPW